jgi:aryl-alcohol dehydrogenase-like predicted oxidoreductase
MCEMLWLADRHNRPPVVSSQIPLSLLRREFQYDLAFCQQHGVGVTPYQSLQGGLLTGKYRRGQPAPADSRAAEKPDWMWKADDALFDRLEGIERLATEAGVSMTRLALAWALAQPAISSLIVGVKRLDQLEDAVAAADVQLSPERLQKLDAICPPPWRQPDPIRG